MPVPRSAKASVLSPGTPLNVVASWAKEGAVFKAKQRGGVGLDRLHQNHFGVADQAPHRTQPLVHQ
jgi:hypothetical protein